MPEPNTPVRYHAMAALRALAMLLGIVFHAALSYMPIDVDWAIIDRSTSVSATVFVVISHSFRLPVFFIIAGFFARLVYHRRGFAGFVAHRARRVLIPFVVAWFAIRPLLISGWIWGETVGNAGFLTAIRDGWDSFVSSLSSPKMILVGSHLWFLYYLLLLYTAFLLIRNTVGFVVDRRGRLRARLDQAVRLTLHSPWCVVILAMPTTAFLWGMNEPGLDTPNDTLVPHVPVLLVYGSQFALGWFLHRQPDLLETFSRRWKVHLLLAVIVTAPVLCVTPDDLADARSWSMQTKIVATSSYALMMWAWILGCVGVVIRYFDRPRRSWHYIADSSYWLYIVHLPLVVWLQVAFANLALPWVIKMSLILAITAPLLLVSYHYLVRSSFIGVTLNGRKYPFRWLPWSAGLEPPAKG